MIPPAAIIQSLKEKPLGVPKEFLAGISDNISPGAALSFDQFYTTLVDDVRTQNDSKLLELMGDKIYLIKNSRTFVFQSKISKLRMIASKKVRCLFERITASPNDLDLRTEGVIWHDGEALFVPVKTGDLVVWKIDRLIVN